MPSFPPVPFSADFYLEGKLLRATSSLRVTRGTTANIVIVPLIDHDFVNNLEIVTRVDFVLRNSRSRELAVEKTKPSDSGISINDPEDGKIRVVLTPGDTLLVPGFYDLSIQLEWETQNPKLYEWPFGEKLQIVPDVIN